MRSRSATGEGQLFVTHAGHEKAYREALFERAEHPNASFEVLR
ncbi:hypothetical protein [Streptomyces sp. NPDC056982]